MTPGGPVPSLVDDGLLHPEARRIFRRKDSGQDVVQMGTRVVEHLPAALAH